MKNVHWLAVVLISFVCAAVTLKLAPSLSSTKLTTSSADIESDQLIAQLLARVDQLEAQLGELKFSKTNESSTNYESSTNAVEATVSALSNSDATLFEPAQSNDLIDVRAAQVSDNRVQRLIRGGFTEQEASWVLEQESQLQLDLLQEQHLARKRRAELDLENGTQVPNRFERFRDRLGDDAYERYLKANGFSTEVNIGRVITGSPGQNAGLRQDDQITHYDGQRVFNVGELNSLTINGEQGETVLLEVQRNGQPVQITIQRGPIGIVSGRGFSPRQGRG